MIVDAWVAHSVAFVYLFALAFRTLQKKRLKIFWQIWYYRLGDLYIFIIIFVLLYMHLQRAHIQ